MRIMRLQIDGVRVEDVRPGSKTRLKGKILYIDTCDLERALLSDKRIKSVKIDLVRPGSSVRIVNVIDVVQPRCKTEPEGTDFPGWLGKLNVAGNGRAVCLEGIVVTICNRFSHRSYSAILDMSGWGSELSKYGKMPHVVLDPEPVEHVSEREFELAAREAGLRAAVYLAAAGSSKRRTGTEIFDLKPALGRKGKLPRVGYCYMLYTPQHDYQGISDPIFYGGQVTEILPTIVHPNEILDGALVNALTVRGMETYSIQNHAVIKELYKRHGRDLVFAGMIVYAATMEPLRRQRNAMIAASLASNVLKADGMVLTKCYGGMPHVDEALVAEACENMGIKTTMFVHLVHSGSSLANSALFSSPKLDAIINVGQALERIVLPKAEKILGGNPDTPIYNPDVNQTAGSAGLDVEQFLLAGLHDHLGSSRIVAVDY
jgi:glycine reductase